MYIYIYIIYNTCMELINLRTYTSDSLADVILTNSNVLLGTNIHTNLRALIKFERNLFQEEDLHGIKSESYGQSGNKQVIIRINVLFSTLLVSFQQSTMLMFLNLLHVFRLLRVKTAWYHISTKLQIYR
jgi:hypothetical protein